MVKRVNADNFFIAWTIFELGLAVILLLILPSTIKINFGFILTNQETVGSKYNVLALPVAMLLVSGLLKYSSKFYNPILRMILIVVNSIVLIGTTFFLLQLFVIR
ncbi:MAG: hypothetical protein FWE43_02385 [Streptococcaceae bacterium]|nr:hypothetical protein [Streptococcaceae bacterium]